MLTKQYLLDSNCFIQGARYYPQDIFPSFWTNIKKLIDNNTIVIHETVLDELYENKDDLTAWLKTVPSFEKVTISEDVLKKYVEIDEWVRNPKQNYTSEAISNFENNKKADAWICAQCAVDGYILVTNEKFSNAISNVKIPKVCKEFDIPCMSMFDFMRIQKFIF